MKIFIGIFSIIMVLSVGILMAEELNPLTGYWGGTYNWDSVGNDTWPIGLGIDVSPTGRIAGVIGVFTLGNYGDWAYKVSGQVTGNRFEFTYKGTTHNHLFTGQIDGSQVSGRWERSDGHYGTFQLTKNTAPISLRNQSGYWEGSYNWDSAGDDTVSVGLGMDINLAGNVKGVIGVYSMGYYGKTASKVTGNVINNIIRFTYQGGAYSYSFTGTIVESTISGTWRRSDNNYGTFKIVKYHQYKRFIPDDYFISHPNTLFFDNFNDGNIDGWTYNATNSYSFGGSAILNGRYANNSYLRCNKEFDWKKPFRIDVSLKFTNLIHPPLACMGVRFFKTDVPDGGKYVGVYIRNEPADSRADPYGKVVEIYRQDKDYNTVSFNWNEQWFYNLTFIVRDGVVYVYVKKEDVNSISDKPMLVGKIDVNTPGYGNRFDLFTYSASAEFDYVIVSKIENKIIYVPKDYPTIQDAVNNADYGDSIVVAEGNYAGAVLSDGLTLTGAGADKTKITGILTAGNNCLIENLAVIGGYIRIEKNIKDVVIRRLLLKDGACGILAFGNNTFIAENNTIVNHGYMDKNGKPQGAGIYYQQFSNVLIQNNIVANNPGYGIVTWWYNSKATVQYNDVFNNGKDYVIAQPGIGSISKDPLFRDTANSNYHLTKNSLCIDAGNPENNYNDPDGSRNDMGAFPYKAPLVAIEITKIPDKVLKHHKYNVEWELKGDFKVVEQTDILWGLKSGEYTFSGKSFSGGPGKYTDKLRAPKMLSEKEPFYIYLVAHAIVEGEDFYSAEKKILVIHDNGKDKQKSAMLLLTPNPVEGIAKPIQVVATEQIRRQLTGKGNEVAEETANAGEDSPKYLDKRETITVKSSPKREEIKRQRKISKQVFTPGFSQYVSALQGTVQYRLEQAGSLSTSFGTLPLPGTANLNIESFKIWDLQSDRGIRIYKDGSYIKFGDGGYSEAFKFYKPWDKEKDTSDR